jgi:RNA polymerase sigma factor (sigma-70 family)
MSDQAASRETHEETARGDRELILACLEGDARAWEELITRYQRLIYSIPIKARLSPDDAADVFQSVCLKVFERLSTLRDHERIISWLITTTTREVWRVSGRNRREGAASLSNDAEGRDLLNGLADGAPLADEQRQIIERQEIVRQGVRSLPDRCRSLIGMLFYEKGEPSYADIARRLNMPVPSVGPTRARCLEKLKKLLESKG